MLSVLRGGIGSGVFSGVVLIGVVNNSIGFAMMDSGGWISERGMSCSVSRGTLSPS